MTARSILDTGHVIEARWAALWLNRWSDGICRLRFDLAGDRYSLATQPVPRALLAFVRARTVADALFGDGGIGIVTYLPTDRRNGRTTAQTPDEAPDVPLPLRELGMASGQLCAWMSRIDPDEDDLWSCRAFQVSDTPRDALLWNAIISDLPIQPKWNGLSFLLHPSLDVLLHAYDDRGMDVVASSAELLRPIYERYGHWLLEHDRRRVAQALR